VTYRIPCTDLSAADAVGARIFLSQNRIAPDSRLAARFAAAAWTPSAHLACPDLDFTRDLSWLTVGVLVGVTSCGLMSFCRWFQASGGHKSSARHSGHMISGKRIHEEMPEYQT
jgi:hypothetical protein